MFIFVSQSELFFKEMENINGPDSEGYLNNGLQISCLTLKDVNHTKTYATCYKNIFWKKTLNKSKNKT